MVTIDVKLMGSLLTYGSQSQSELIQTSLEDGSTVLEAVQSLGIPKERIKLILVNHKGALLDQPLINGDRVSLFPAEYPVFTDWEGSILRKGIGEEMIGGESKIQN